MLFLHPIRTCHYDDMSQTACSDDNGDSDRLQEFMDRVRERNLREGNILTEEEAMELAISSPAESPTGAPSLDV